MRLRLRGFLAVSAAVVGILAAPLQAQPAAAAAAPDQMVAYVDYTTMDGLYLRDMQTGETRHLLAGTQTAMPVLSPDATRVAYAAPGSVYHTFELWVAPTDGSGSPTDLTSLSCNVQNPAWSADGTKIVFGCSDAWGSQAIVVDSTTGDQIGLGVSGESPSFSPDGTKLVVQQDPDNIGIVDLTGETEQSTTIAHGIDPRWSPDGTRILYGTTGARNQLWAVNPDGRSASLLADATPGSDDSVQSWAWSADSRTIVFSGRVIEPNDSADNADLFLIDRNGLQRWPIASTASVDEQFVTVSGSLHATAPTAPTNVAATTSLNKASALVSWSAPASNGGAPVTGYDIEAENQPGGSFISHVVTSNTSVLFTGLTFGETYYFTVAAANAEGTGPWSTPGGPITPRVATRTAITSITSSYLYGKGWAHVGGTITRLDTDTAAIGAWVRLQSRPAGSTKPYRTLTWDVTDAHGHVRFGNLKPARNTEYRLVTLTHGPSTRSTSIGHAVLVHPAATIALTRNNIAAGATTLLIGKIAPDLTGRTVVLQRWHDGSWHRIATTRLRTASKYSFTIHENHASRFRFRVKIPASPTLGAGYSPAIALTVQG